MDFVAKAKEAYDSISEDKKRLAKDTAKRFVKRFTENREKTKKISEKSKKLGKRRRSAAETKEMGKGNKSLLGGKRVKRNYTKGSSGVKAKLKSIKSKVPKFVNNATYQKQPQESGGSIGKILRTVKNGRGKFSGNNGAPLTQMDMV